MTRTSPFAESLFSRIRLDLACGIGLLTRLPINGLLSARQRAQSGPWPLARSLWCWPLVGGAVGAFTGSMAWGLEALHVAALPAAGLALAAQSALTGAFHEDGLADMADSYGTHARERKLEIMRDSRIGSYGVLALCLSLLVRAGAIAALPAPALVGGLALAGLLSRATLLWLPRLLPPARPDGLARSLSPLPRGAFAVAQSFAFLLAALLMTGLINGTSQQPVLPENQPLFWRLAPALGLVISAAGLSGWLVARSARKHLAGYTGDVLGGAATVADCLVLAALTILFHN